MSILKVWRLMVLPLVALLLILSACGKFDPTSQATAPPVAPSAPEPPAPEPSAEPSTHIIAVDAPTDSSPPPTPPDNAPAATPQPTNSFGTKIIAYLNSAPGMTKVVVGDDQKTETYIFPTTNEDEIIKRVAKRMLEVEDNVRKIITFQGDAQPSSTRSRGSNVTMNISTHS